MNAQQTVGRTLDCSPFAGEWINTNEGTREIDRISLRIDEERMYLRVYGNLHPGGSDWGEIAVDDVYADPSSPKQAVSFVAHFRLASVNVEVGVNLNQGLLVMAMFNSWNTNGQKDYFAREFFRQ